MRWPTLGSHVGVALSPDRLVASLPDGRRLETTEVTDLRRAFTELRESAGTRRATVSVALVPPLVQVRHIALPPMRELERQRVVARDAGRYFVGLREPQVVASTPTPVFAAAAPAALVEQIEAAVASVGWVLAVIMPAHSAWAVAGNGHVVARLAHVTELLRIERGRVMERRRLRTADVVPPDVRNPILIEDPVTMAAMHAPDAFEPDLCSETRNMLRQRKARRVASALGGASLVCSVLAAAVNYWGIDRELAAVRKHRAQLVPQVAAAMQLRDSLSVLTTNLTTFGNLEGTAPRWSALLADLADYLPRDAHVVALRGNGDSVVVEGVGSHAIGVFQAFQRMPRLTAVRATAPIRQDIASNGMVREQFALGARLREVP